MEESIMTLIELTKKKKIPFTLSWITLGLSILVFKLLEIYYTRPYER